MKVKASTPDEYVQAVPEPKREGIAKLRAAIQSNIPDGFEEVMSYGMIGYVVPHTLYPPGYHCDPKLPLPFINIAAQKNFVAVYHMGIYADPELLEWFVTEYPKHSDQKLDMGKSCIRFKKIEAIPYELIGQLAQKMTVKDVINIYEKSLKR